MAVYAVFTRAGREILVRDKIRDMVLRPGEEVYVPLYNRQKKYGGEYKIVSGVLFPGYLFCKTEDAEDLKKRLRMILECAKLLGSENIIIPLKGEEEMLLYKLCGEEHVLDVSTGYYEGDSVRIIKGPLMGLEGRIVKINRHKRIAVLSVELMQRSMEITVGLEVVC